MNHFAALAVLASIVAAGLPAQSPGFALIEESVPPAGLAIPRLADFDANGSLDLMHRSQVALNDGDAWFRRSGFVQLQGLDFSGREILADVDQDGLIDILQPLQGSMFQQPSLRFHRNQGQGRFVLTPLAQPAFPPSSLCLITPGPRLGAAGDLDGDGDADLVMSSELCLYAGALVLWRNDGGATFSDASQLLPAIVADVTHLELLDAEGDGDLDIFFLTTALSGGRNLLLNLGGAGFVPAPGTIGTGAPADAVTSGDFNGDGWIDLAFTGGPGLAWNDEVVFGPLATGGTAFTTPRKDRAWDLAAIDIDLDGRDELLRSGPSQLTLHDVSAAGIARAARLALGAGSRSQTQVRIETGDLDGDGDHDLVAADPHRITVLLNDGAGQLVEASRPIPFLAGLRPSQTADLEGDGDVDILLTAKQFDEGNWPLALVNDGTGHFSQSPGLAVRPLGAPAAVVWQLLDGDLDGDQDLFCLQDHTPGGGHYFTFSGMRWTLAASYGFQQSGTVTRTFARDFDGDGDADLLVGRRLPGPNGGPAPTTIIPNLGGGVLGPAVPFPAPRSTWDIAVADADGDGDLDVFQANDTYPQAAVSSLWLIDGAGAFTEHPAFPAVAARSVGAADLDGDGDVDVILDDRVYRNDGPGGYNLASTLVDYFVPIRVDIGDLDADGDPDLVDGLGHVRWNLGGLMFGPPAQLPTRDDLSGEEIHTIADVDQDGDLDVIGSGPVVIFNQMINLSRQKPARVGRTGGLELVAAPGTPYQLFSSSGTSQFPLPPFGTLLLDPATAVPVWTDVIGPRGVSVIPLPVPANPTLAGAVAHFQVWLPALQRLTGRSTVVVLAP